MHEVVFTILIVAFGQGMFLFFVLSLNKQGRKHNIFLALLFISFSLQLFDMALLLSKRALSYPHLALWSQPFNLLFGPALYFYIQSWIRPINFKKPRFWTHFIPFTLYMVYVVIVYQSKSTAFKIEYLESIYSDISKLPSNQISYWAIAFIAGANLYFIIYLFCSFRSINSSKTLLSMELTKWLTRLWMAILAIEVFALLRLFLIVLVISLYPITAYIGGAISIIYIYYGALILLRKQKLIFEDSKRKYHYSDLTEENTTDILNNLRDYMLKQKPYLNPKLTIGLLAKESNISERSISQAINQQLSKSFTDFVNEYRVEEFKQKCTDTNLEHMSLLGLAMDAGFQSKSAFNMVFKKVTGLTPSQYKKSLKS
ncbi:MAG: helix-turn-helix domain-containing protein [bacterium]|nr:helix-turn-helix domain-containing protein [bacterium]